MQNKTPIVVLTGLGIVAAAAVAGLTRDQWMGHKTEVVATTTAPQPTAPDQSATAPQPAQPAATQPAETQPAETQPAEAKTADTTAPAATGTQPAPEAAKPADANQQTAATPPATQAEQPAAGNAAGAAKVPAFDTVRVEKTGEAVIAGTAAPGADVVVMLDGKPIGETTANSDGAFVLVPSTPLPVGSGALTLEAKSQGAAEATPSQQSVAVIVPAADQPQEALVAVVSPDQPTRVLQKPEVKQDATAPAVRQFCAGNRIGVVTCHRELHWRREAGGPAASTCGIQIPFNCGEIAMLKLHTRARQRKAARIHTRAAR